jgi:RimJ/RimL family protein N-acetyltransferase
MRLRYLNDKDVEGMLEWMHDDSIVHDLFTDFSTKNISDCSNFIRKSLVDKENLNLAVVDENDVYMGTVSLKHIDKENENAEFAITMRSVAMGKGYAIYGMNQIMDRAKNDLGLESVYWCVLKKNLRAVSFYNKHNFKLCSQIPQNLKKNYTDDLMQNLIWYCIRFW